MLDEQNKAVAQEDFLCPCGSGKKYSECCSKFHAHEAWPENAEEMVRARFCAYALRKYEYVIETGDPTNDELKIDLEELRKNADEVTWENLEILSPVTSESYQGRSMDVVDYLYVYRVGAGLFQRTERGMFSHVDGKLYFYVGAELRPQPIHAGPKIGRNDPCPCGSGKKYKKCCGKGL